MNSKVFVTDAQMRSSLAVIRSLGKRGIRVTAGEETRWATGFFSRYCSNRVVYPSPKRDRDAFVDFLIGHLRENTYDALFPVAEFCLEPVMEHYDEISRYTRIGLAPPDIFMAGFDKCMTLKIARENNIPCPQTFFIQEPDDLRNLAGTLGYPVVLKPCIGAGRRGVEVCNSPEELKEKYDRNYPLHGRQVLQEFIPSAGEFGVYTLFNRESEPRAVAVQRRIRSYPHQGGPSTLRETFKDEVSTHAVQTAFHLLRSLRWSGPAMVEFRIDARDTTPKLMEVNPRFWGSLQLSILAGVDFPYLYYRMIMEGDVDPVLDYTAGVRCRWLLPGDILWFLTAPDKLKNLPEFLKPQPHDDIISLQDPGPTMGFFLAALRYAFDRDMWRLVLRR